MTTPDPGYQGLTQLQQSLPRDYYLDPITAELQVQWLFAPDTLADPEFEAAAVAGFAERVILQGTRICEINRRGLRALPHTAGVLMPEEYEVYGFQQWVRRQLGD